MDEQGGAGKRGREDYGDLGGTSSFKGLEGGIALSMPDRDWMHQTSVWHGLTREACQQHDWWAF